MLKNLLNTGKRLDKSEQKSINAGSNVCAGYNGPIIIPTCEEFYEIPEQFRGCVLVLDFCF
ncbi:MAG: hypothetical protein AAFQ94_10385 [Bacteroidota bacterium]